MQIETTTLRDGLGTADIHRRPSHGQVKAIMAAYRKHSDDESVMDIQTVAILTLVDRWTLLDDKGKDMSIPLSRDGVESAPQAAVNAVWEELTTVLEGAFPNL